METKIELLEKKLKAYKNDNTVLKKVHFTIMSGPEPIDHNELKKLSVEQEIVLLKIKVIEELYKDEFKLQTLKELKGGD